MILPVLRLLIPPGGGTSEAILDVGSVENYMRDEVEGALQTLRDLGVTDAWYWYRYGSYEGEGDLIVIDGQGLWGIYSMAHCSCYGPLENMYKSSFTWRPSRDELMAACSDWERERVGMLLGQIPRLKGEA